jgi:hypothetical protein
MGTQWGSDVEIERKNRITLSVAAWAYEKHDEQLMSDHDYDALCEKIRPEMSTGNRKMDNFFKKHFDPNTGQWVHKHPQKAHLELLWRDYYSKLV